MLDLIGGIGVESAEVDCGGVEGVVVVNAVVGEGGGGGHGWGMCLGEEAVS